MINIIKDIILAIVAIVVVGLNSPSDFDTSAYTQIKFTEMYETTDGTKVVSQTLRNLDGKKVKLSGYMAEQSPVDESFIYLVSQPYVVCPFCTIGDITMLEVMPVSMANGGTISVRNMSVDIYGTLEVIPREDAFGHATQFRIIADRVVNLDKGVTNSITDEYYNELNEKGMIFDIQTLQMALDSIINPVTIKTNYGTTNPVEVIDKIKADSSWDYSEYIDLVPENGTGMQGYVKYIKECPEIIASVTPTDEKLMVLNEELINIYEKQIVLMEEIAVVVDDIKLKEMSEEEKIATYNLLISFCNRNLALFEEFTTWNNKLRE